MVVRTGGFLRTLHVGGEALGTVSSIYVYNLTVESQNKSGGVCSLDLVQCDKRMRAPEVPNAKQTGKNRTVIWHGVRYVLRSQILQGLARLLPRERCLYLVLGYPITVTTEHKVWFALYCLQ